ncbi:hypothetical protein O6P43_000018, partial [Quillaja saponaria]
LENACLTYSDGSLISFPLSLSLATSAFMASFLFLLANTFTWIPLKFGSFFSTGGGGGGLLAAALALCWLKPNPSTALVKPIVTVLHVTCTSIVYKSTNFIGT